MEVNKMAHRWDYTCKGTDYLGKDEEKSDIEGLCNGTTFYAVDTKKLYVYYDDEWFEM